MPPQWNGSENKHCDYWSALTTMWSLCLSLPAYRASDWAAYHLLVVIVNPVNHGWQLPVGAHVGERLRARACPQNELGVKPRGCVRGCAAPTHLTVGGTIMHSAVHARWPPYTGK